MLGTASIDSPAAPPTMLPPNIPANNNGPGSQYLNSGQGPQSNNTGSGTQYNNTYYGIVTDQMTEDEKNKREKAECLQSLCFFTMHARKQDINDAHPRTCDWFYKTAEFQEWRDRTDLSTHNGVLWIKGKPGAGKSTLMKHTLRYCEKVFNDHLIVSYFFNARGEILEKTPQGMMQSIVYQLLDKDTTLYESFVPIFREMKIVNKSDNWVWRYSQLKGFVLSKIKEWKSKPILFLIDALDECIEDDVRDVVRFLERLSLNATQSNNTTLRICLSSRHYPNVSIGASINLTIEENREHREDIAIYVAESLRKQNYDIEAEINKKADGIFMWVVIVVSLLNKAYNKGKVEAMQKALKEVPEDLEQVFNLLLGKDDTNKTETILMLQWVLLSERQLKPEELYFATLVGTDPEHSGLWDRSKHTKEIIFHRITTSSKGLIEIRKGEFESAQFIHLSVKDFLYRHKRLQTLDPGLDPDPIRTSHARLWACCWSCMKRLDSILLAQESDIRVVRNYPFLEYAATYIFDHAEKALSDNNFGTSNETKRWLQRSRDWFSRYKLFLSFFPGLRVLRMGILFEDKDVGPLYILSYCGYENLIKVILETSNNIHIDGDEYGKALHAASAAGYEKVVGLLLAAGANINFQGGEYGSALLAALAGKNEEIINFLLAKGIDINLQDGIYGTALQQASLRGREKIVQLLLANGANANLQGGICGSALQIASAEGQDKIVKLLLENGANINLQDNIHGSALQVASAEGKNKIVELLLENGANINLQGSIYGSALQAASAKSKEDTVRLLLAKSADVNLQGGIYGSALQAASAGSREDTIRLLLAKGADVNLQGGMYGSALQAASSNGKEEIVELLLKNGADVNLQGGIYGSALQAALAKGNKKIVELLLASGANVNLQGGKYRSALQAASVKRIEDIAFLFLTKDANANLQGIIDKKLLQAASLKEKEDTKRPFMESGAGADLQPPVQDNAERKGGGRIDRERLIATAYLSLHPARLLPGIILTLFGLLMLHTSPMKHITTLVLRPLSVAALGVKAWTISTLVGFQRLFMA